MAKTLREQYTAGILKLGYRQVESRGKKFQEFRREGEPGAFFLGRNGAVRHGRTLTESVSALPQTKRSILKAAGAME